jgi:hypothetical protein
VTTISEAATVATIAPTPMAYRHRIAEMLPAQANAPPARVASK